MKVLAGIVVVMAAGIGLPALQAQTVCFEALAKQKSGTAEILESSCVLLDDRGTLVTVAKLGADVSKAGLAVDGNKVPLKFVAADQDSRLVIYMVPAESVSLLPAPAQLGSSRRLTPSTAVYTSPARQDGPARIASKVHWFQGRVLPLAVLRVSHSQSPPATGTGLYDAEGKLVCLVRQTAHNSKTSTYCLPVEVITRTLEDFQRNKRVNRCWIGIIMDQLVAEPMIEGVRPGSPASKAGLLKGDIILSIAGQHVTDYAGVVDAFYYLVAGIPRKVRIIRGTEVLELEVVPEAVPGSQAAP